MIGFRSISKSAAIHHDALCFAAPKMAEYMMDRAKFLCQKETEIQEEIANGNHDAVLADMVIGNELQTILSILKDAGVEVVNK